MRGQVILIRNPFEWRKPATWFYSLIRVFIGRWNHAAIIDVDANVVYDMQAEGLRRRGYFFWRSVDYKRQTCFSEIIEMPNHPSGFIGKYDYSIYPNYLLYRLFGWAGYKMRPNKRLYCFELVEYCLGWDRDADLVTGIEIQQRLDLCS